MSKKFKKFLLFATASAAIISMFVMIDKKRKAYDSLFEEDDVEENDAEKNVTEDNHETDTLKTTKLPVHKNISLNNSSRTYINLV
ncbi:MAG: hypothetical protein IJA36_08665 [Lachnospiraceae bacterium]|nr:hypothetical protein [Lachnospiraceae bacterium]